MIDNIIIFFKNAELLLVKHTFQSSIIFHWFKYSDLSSNFKLETIKQFLNNAILFFSSDCKKFKLINSLIINVSIASFTLFLKFFKISKDYFKGCVL